MLHAHVLLEGIRSVAFALKTVAEKEPVIRTNAMDLIANTDFIDTAGRTGDSSDEGKTFNVRAWLNCSTLDVLVIWHSAFLWASYRLRYQTSPVTLWKIVYCAQHDQSSTPWRPVQHCACPDNLAASAQLIGSLIGCSRYLSSRLGVIDSVDFENISRYNRRPYFQKGTVVAVSTYTMHHNSAIYKDPEAYEPGRWFDPGQSVKGVQYPV